MKALIQKRLKNQKGLTLIELLVVIVILGIIAAIAIPQLTGNRDAAAQATNTQNLKLLQDGVQRYYVEVGDYPTSANLKEKLGLDPLPTPVKFAGCDDSDFKYTLEGEGANAKIKEVDIETSKCIKND
ncbi:type II secretion system protein [Alkalihalobacterium sp. APHAB7]|uniref:type II secretion system protein n=1 Tax=Alkalihalobacterium sp. APHAB7 TaxID=3402081 RepID=UPI003AAC8B1C